MRPMPGLADLPRLIEESRAAGMRIDIGNKVDDGVLSALPDVAGRTVYRVVQEGLTNVRKHAPGAAAQVTLDGGTGAGLDVTIANRLPSADAGPDSAARAAMPVPGAGTGLIGLSERLELAGGTLESGTSGGEFLLHAWLPWPE
jgi:signal transduction histidine kinase